ncbi:hypothetical protein ACRAWF_07860 [Streptomyces sp. L7]
MGLARMRRALAIANTIAADVDQALPVGQPDIVVLGRATGSPHQHPGRHAIALHSGRLGTGGATAV